MLSRLRDLLGCYELPAKPVFTKTGCLFFPTKIHHDERGFFLEHYQMTNFSSLYRKYFSNTNFMAFLQDNISFSKKNVVRGMHMQAQNPQAKLIRVLSGSVVDVVIDMQKNSRTYGFMEMFKLTNISDTLYIPPTHAHGFWALEDTVFSYKCSMEYKPNDECGINPLDPNFNFPWNSIKDEVIISPKDRALPFFSN